ncbi:hypothetical protein C9J21_20620 [Photobacterium phosphoreum]|nr:hypothetical protein C9J21_20620 [Photobacterium phosphoreum]
MCFLRINQKKNILTHNEKTVLQTLNLLGEPVFISINKLSILCGVSESIVESTISGLINKKHIEFDRSPFGSSCNLTKLLIKKPRKNKFFHTLSVLRFFGR